MSTTGILDRVAANTSYQNPRLERNRALSRVMTELLKDDTDLFKHFSNTASLEKCISDSVFEATCKRSA